MVEHVMLHCVNVSTDLISLLKITCLSVKNSGLDIVNVGQISQRSVILFIKL